MNDVFIANQQGIGAQSCGASPSDNNPSATKSNSQNLYAHNSASILHGINLDELYNDKETDYTYAWQAYNNH